MQDFEIRQILHLFLSETNSGFKDTIILDELDVCNGLARIDVAVINGVIHGYEIKSEEDTLLRLSGQIHYYNQTLEKITIVVNPVHLEKVLKLVPAWWGVLVMNTTGNKDLHEVRQAVINPLLNSKSLLQLLWKEELFSILQNQSIKHKKNSNRQILGELISNELDIETITQVTRELLKSRKNWRN